MSDAELLEKYRKEVVAPLAQWLDEEKYKLIDMSDEHFANLINFLLKQAFQKILTVAKVQKLEELNKKLRAAVAMFTISDFNSVLPLDYPHIAVIVKFEDRKSWNFGSIPRDVLQGAHDIISNNVVPILKLKKVKNADGKIQNEIISVEYISPETEIDPLKP